MKQKTNLVKWLAIACIIVAAAAAVIFAANQQWDRIIPYVVICILCAVILKQNAAFTRLHKWNKMLEKGYGELTKAYLEANGIGPDTNPDELILTNVKKVEL